ncbi:MAG: S-methyl-5'-thioadenosine phosphorylase [Candidatus Aenigmarchaeota archaeon]|nr:S-methyl-5'-thioadenosine phosphorylase [Candidatus Aenigmarchaeota archaeon]
MDAEIAVIGGTGSIDPAELQDARRVEIKTPFGNPSDEITLGTFQGRKLAFLPRHGKLHALAPHQINYRANIFALKSLGVQRILSPCAVGSLQKQIRPGDFVIADQFFDFTRGRERTFYESGRVCHISVAEPFCPELRSVAGAVAKALSFSHHTQGTYVCIEGPRFSTKAESLFFRAFGHVVGMTLVPEAVLAREAEICYVPIAMVTDWDVWKEEPVSIEKVVATMNANTEKIKKLLQYALPRIPAQRACGCKDALKHAFVA